jgi:plastocyanin
MKKALTIMVAVCALGAAGFALAAQMATKTVNIRGTGFSPRTVTVAGGDTVVWRNLDTVDRQVVANNGSFASGIIRPNRTYTRPMNTPGTYPYHDALKPAHKGTVRVIGPAPSVSIGASLPIATFGTAVRVSGAISPAASGDTVTVWAQPYGQASFVEIGRVQTTTNGIWDITYTPQILTSYKATWKGRTSAVIMTSVAPQVSLIRVRRWFVTRVRAARSFNRRWVQIQRLNGFGQWVTLKKVQLNRQSAQRTKLRLPRGISRVRAFITTNQAGAGYVFSMSPTVTVRRR